MSVPLVEFDQVTLAYQDRPILNRLSLSIPAQGLTLLLGPSGVGKTTLFKLITGQICPDQGDVRINGQSMTQASLKVVYQLRKQMGMLFQSAALLSELTVFENIGLPLKVHLKLTESTYQERVHQALDHVGLSDAGALYPRQLSGGMSKRAAFARAMILNPVLMLYDEPLSAQDPVTCQSLLKLMHAGKIRQGHAGIVISHQIQSLLPIVDHIVLLDRTGIVFEGTPEAASLSVQPLLRAFLSMENSGWLSDDDDFKLGER